MAPKTWYIFTSLSSSILKQLLSFDRKPLSAITLVLIKIIGKFITSLVREVQD